MEITLDYLSWIVEKGANVDNISFRDLGRQYQVLKNKIDGALKEVVEDGQYIGGPQVNELEKRLAEYVGVNYCVSCGNGTDALQLALMAYDIGPGDAVFIPDFTFFATGEIIPTLGATPVFVDIDSKTFNLDPTSLQKAIKEIIREGELRPAAVIPVDLFGLPADYLRILEISQEYDLRVIEDAAQGLGGAIDKKRACSFGDIATTSFFPAKPLGCYGDGGAIFTNDEEIMVLLNSLKVHGKGSHKYENVRIGMNSRLDTLQAAVLLVKLEALIDYELDAMDSVRTSYNEGLKDVVEVPFIPKGFYTCNAQYTIKLPDLGIRDGLKLYLKEQGIPTNIYYPTPLHKQLAFSKIGSAPVNLDISTKMCETVLSLPIHPYLKQDEVAKIIDRVEEGISSIG